MNGAVFYAVFTGVLMAGCAMSTESGEEVDDPFEATNEEEGWAPGAPADHSSVCRESWSDGSYELARGPNAEPFEPGWIPVACRDQESYRGDPWAEHDFAGDAQQYDGETQ
jgi:hypothetical protein